MIKEYRVNSKVSSVEGVRGLVAVIVFIHHFVLMFYPAAYWRENNTLCDGIEVIVGQTPLGFFISGNSAVMIFLIITGFGTYIMFDRASEEKKTSFWLLRFPKMFVMIWISVLFIWVLIKCNLVWSDEVTLLTGSPWLVGWGPSEMNLFKLMTYNVFDVGNMYNGTFWTMYWIFAGSYLSMLVHSLVGGKEKASAFILFIFTICLLMKSIYFLPIIMGCFCAEYYLKHPNQKIGDKIGGGIFVLSVFLWSCPSSVRSGYMYEVLPIITGGNQGWHMIGAFLFIMLALHWSPLKRCMECRGFQWLAKHSMAIYVLHFGVLISFSSFCYQKLIVVIGHNRATLITLGASILVLGIGAWCYNKTVAIIYKRLDKLCLKLIHALEHH